jgi:hypothetical protein
MKDLADEVLKAYIRGRGRQYDTLFKDFENFVVIYTDRGFKLFDSDCDGFCLECRKVFQCEALYR